MDERFDTDERRRLSAVLEAVEGSATLADCCTRILAALDEHLGVQRSALMLALAEPHQPGRRAYAGTQHGLRPHVLEEYFERWGRYDALTSDEARAAYATNGYATVKGVYPRLGPAHRRYVDEFLRRTGGLEQFSFRLTGSGWTEAYLTLTDNEEPRERERRLVAALAPELASRLQRHLPRGIPATLSVRESQAAELVALGFSNRQIAEVLAVEEDTIKKHLSHAAKKLGARGRAQLAVGWTQGARVELPAAIVPAASARTGTDHA